MKNFIQLQNNPPMCIISCKKYLKAITLFIFHIKYPIHFILLKMLISRA